VSDDLASILATDITHNTALQMISLAFGVKDLKWPIIEEKAQRLKGANATMR